ncbi:MAG: hypothetical protein M1830_008537 [Pleopsidium flavum]|nr:MAG: hypothetical protein M1830_008537 [Pleopsidium flavum]
MDPLSVSPSMDNPRSVSDSIFAILQLSDSVIGHLRNMGAAFEDCGGVIMEVIDEASSISDLLKSCGEQARWSSPWSMEGRHLVMSETPLEKYQAVLEHLASRFTPIADLKRREPLTRRSDKGEMEAILITMRQHKSSFRLALQNQIEEAMQWIWSQRKDNVELAKRVLAWVSCAQRRLTVLEIQHALAVVPGNTAIDKDALIDEELLLSVCAGLVGIDKASKELHFIHRTCQEYVERTVPDWFPTAQLEIGKTCLTYLTCNVFLGEPDGSDQGMENQMRKYPFLRYAAHFWGVHVRGEPVMVLKELVLTFLEQESISSFAMQLLQSQELRHKMRGQSSPEPVTRLWLAAYFGLEEICRLLLANGDDLDAKTRSGETALYRAVVNGHEAVIQLLLEKGADVNAQEGYYGNALQTASRQGHEATVQLLLDEGADVNTQKGYYGTALQIASRQGHEAIVRLLLKKGADVNTQKEYYGTALQTASEHGHEAIVRLLLEKGADVNAQEGNYDTALQTASRQGHETIVRLLLKKKADVNTQKEYYGTALQTASEHGHEAIVRLLLEKGADVNAQEGNYGTALQTASRQGHEAIVRLLLEKGADANAQKGHSDTSLQRASEQGHEAIVRLLIEKGADANAQKGHSDTSLQRASEQGHEAIVRLLIEKGADNARGGFCNAMQAASERGHEAIVRLLIEKEADNAQGGFCNAMQAASRHGHEAIVRLLIEKGADANAQGGFCNAMQAASRHGHEAIVRLLIERGADVNARNGFCNAMQTASEHGHEAIVRLLIEKGADVNAQEGYYGNALQAASVSGHVTTVRLLLENGASMNDEQKESTLRRLENNAYIDNEQKAKTLLLLKGRNDSKRNFSGTIHLLLEHSKKHDVAISSAENAEINIPSNRSSVVGSNCYVHADDFVQTHSDHDESQAATHERRTTALTELLSATSPQILPNPPSPDHSAVISSQASEETESSRSDYSDSEFSTDILNDDSDIESFADDEKRKRALTPSQDIDRMFRSPKRYFQELEEIRNEVYERSGLQLYDQSDGQPQPWQWDKIYRKWPWRVSSPADSSVQESDLRDSDVHSFCDLAGAQITARRLFHLLECRNLLLKVCENITTLKKGGFRQDHFSVLVVDQGRPNVAKLVPLNFQRVERLADDFKATLKEEFEVRFSSNISPPDSASHLTQSCIDILDFLGLMNSSNGGLWTPELLWRYAAQTLDLAVVSYAGAHLEPFDQLFGRTLDQFTIQARYVGDSFIQVSLRRRSLRCLDGLLRGKEVWVFQCCLDLDDERLYLSTSADLLAEIWGPLWKSCPASRPEEISCYHVGNGSIIYSPADPNSTPELHPGDEDRGPEVPCHWVPRDQDDIEFVSAHSASSTTFSGTETLLIGAEDIPELRLNPGCHCETARFERLLKENGCRRPNRTAPPTISVASDQISTQFGAGGYGFQVGHSRTFAHNRGITLKEAFIEVWELSPEDRNFEALLQSSFAAEVSICTKHTQRATLGELLSTPTMLNYMKGMRISKLDLRGKFLEALEKPDAMAALHQLYDENEDWQKIIGRAIFLCLKALKHTGVDDAGNLLVLWIPRPGCEWLATLERAVHSWTPMLKDSIDCCTFAVLLDSCLELTGSLLDYGQRCLGPNHTAWDENKGPSVFKTKLCVNERLIPRGLKKKKTHKGPYSERWSISDIRDNCEFSLGKQGRLRVIKPLPYRRLLVKWDKNLLQVLTQDFVEPIRGLLGNAARNYHWENVEDEELDIEPIHALAGLSGMPSPMDLALDVHALAARDEKRAVCDVYALRNYYQIHVDFTNWDHDKGGCADEFETTLKKTWGKDIRIQCQHPGL